MVRKKTDVLNRPNVTNANLRIKAIAVIFGLSRCLLYESYNLSNNSRPQVLLAYLDFPKVIRRAEKHFDPSRWVSSF